MTTMHGEYHASQASSYRPVFHMPKKKDVDKAIAEYERRLGLDESDIKVVVAQNVRVTHWLRSRLDVLRLVKLHTVVKGDLCDVFITKLVTATHQSAVAEIVHQLMTWDAANGVLLTGFLASTLRLPTGTREPDGAVSPKSDRNMPRLVVEVEMYHRSLQVADQWAREYFGLISKLQDLLLVKIYQRQMDTRFSALAVLYHRNATGAPTVTDAVSFGSAPLGEEVMDTLGYHAIRNLPSPLNADGTRPHPPVSPWQPPLNPTITVPATDLFYLRTDSVTHVRELTPHAYPHAQDFSLDLFRLFTRIDRNTVFD